MRRVMYMYETRRGPRTHVEEVDLLEQFLLVELELPDHAVPELASVADERGERRTVF